MIEEAHKAYNDSNFELAFQLYTDLAQKGNTDAQTSLGFMYQNAQGTDKNVELARSWYEKAAAQKQPFALFNLALHHIDGDQFKAHDLFLEAAVLEVPPAQYEVALMLERGLGCVQNYSEAAFWYEEAAKRGHGEAFNNLGVLYKEGHGVVQDYTRARICFERASEKDLPTGHYNLGLMYDQGLGVEQDNNKALELCRKAAYGGHEKAKSIIASLQNDGKIVF
ncbi:MAG: tetratricopeptide repeat protein [Campylobacterota bacterium]|nr:tetratricopeptide repeat protein [Campylobacterota bacterium]